MNSKLFFFVCLFITFFAFPANAQKDGKTFKVVIDAGHGGKDPGCLGTYSKEKDVALDVALKTGKLISDNCPNVKVIYTRNTDVFVELYNRAKIANNNHADLFISFHCNANDNHSAHGVETYVMGLSKSAQNLAVARAENAAMLKEEGYKDHYAGFNPDSPESAVMFSLYSSAYLNNSILLADKVQKNLVGTTHLLDRGVKQAPYWVLWSVSMPSILIEMGFLSNPTEEKYLTDEQHKKDIADAIYRGFASYYTQVTGNRVVTTDQEEAPKTEPNPNKPVTYDNSNDNPSDNQSDKKESDEKAAAIANTPVNPDGVRFVVQFMAVPEQIPLTDKRFKSIPNVNRYYEGGLWKYTAGNENNLQSAKQILQEIKGKYPDAFVIAFKGENKIPVSEAVKLVK
ncbi:MAG: N-acetylmuramoyl-L-alanine amidase [Bacteroidales bacterium]|nr:N-acetylmuramoyl-L-alanine amidase [Bacteroidales bacterium]